MASLFGKDAEVKSDLEPAPEPVEAGVADTADTVVPEDVAPEEAPAESPGPPVPDVEPVPVSPPSSVHSAWVVIEDLKKALADAHDKLDAEIAVWKVALGDEADVVVGAWKETKALLAKALKESEDVAKK